MLKKSKLLLAIMPFILASCGGNNDCAARRESFVKYNCEKRDDASATKYNVMSFDLGLIDEGKTVNVTCKDFTVEVDGNKVTANCLLNATTLKTTYYVYDNIIDSKAITGGTAMVSVYAGWTTDITFSASSNFYCKNQLVTTVAEIIKI